MSNHLMSAIKKLDEGDTSKGIHLSPQEAAAVLARLHSHTVRPSRVVKAMQRQKRKQ